MADYDAVWHDLGKGRWFEALIGRDGVICASAVAAAAADPVRHDLEGCGP